MSKLSVNQKAYLRSFDDGIRFACNRMLEKLFYIPEAWKIGNTKALYDIIYHTIDELNTIATHEEA